MTSFKEKLLTVFALVIFTALLFAFSPVMAQSANYVISWTPVTQYVGDAPITTSPTYILWKRAGTVLTEAKRTTTNQHSTVSTTVAALPGDCFYVVVEVDSVSSKPGPEACIGKEPKATGAPSIRRAGLTEPNPVS